MQEELVRMVAQKTGISEDKARQAAETVLGYLKEKLPPAVSSQLDAVGSGKTGGLGDVARDIGSKITGRE